MNLWIEVGLFCFVWWLGLYLLKRNGQDAVLRWVGLGLLAYALILALGVVGNVVEVETRALFLRWQLPLLLLPLLCWSGALWTLRQRLWQIMQQMGQRAAAERTATTLLLTATLLFSLGLGAVALPFEWIPRRLMIMGLSGDMLMLGVAVGWLDAFDQGEAWRPDFLRSLLGAEITAVLFGLQILVVMRINGTTVTLVLLLLGVLATAILLQVFADEAQALFDRLVFAQTPQLQAERAELREMAGALPRSSGIATTVAVDWDEGEFVKLTRRALSHMDNLPKLATSPLIELPMVMVRLQQKGSEVHTLAKSAELKLILTEAICQLKPDMAAEFDTTSQWRHFNALYYPYVRGLRPYRRQMDVHHLSVVDREALQWLQQEVPPRTLYNWQSAGAKLISAQLWEQMQRVVSE